MLSELFGNATNSIPALASIEWTTLFGFWYDFGKIWFIFKIWIGWAAYTGASRTDNGAILLRPWNLTDMLYFLYTLFFIRKLVMLLVLDFLKSFSKF